MFQTKRVILYQNDSLHETAFTVLKQICGVSQVLLILYRVHFVIEFITCWFVFSCTSIFFLLPTHSLFIIQIFWTFLFTLRVPLTLFGLKFADLCASLNIFCRHNIFPSRDEHYLTIITNRVRVWIGDFAIFFSTVFYIPIMVRMICTSL